MTVCEAAAYYKKQSLTLWDQMLKIYEKYGYYKEKQFSIVLKGQEGAIEIRKMMEKMRKNPPKNIGSHMVKSVGDYEEQIIENLETGEKQNTNLPKSNVLYYDLDKNSWCCVRPSGTEPKIKFYMGVCDSSMEEADKELEILETEIRKIAEDVRRKRHFPQLLQQFQKDAQK